MATADLYNQTGEKIGTHNLPPSAFEGKVNEAVVHQYMKVFEWNRHPHTAFAKTRGEVRGGGRKPWRQKGTGRARAGSNTSPLWRGGGVVFPPKPKEKQLKLPRKMKKNAFRSILIDRAKENRVIVLEDVEFERISTKQMRTLLLNMQLENPREKKLFITPEVDRNFYLSARNIPGVRVKHTGEVNVYDLLLADKLVLFKSAVPMIEERVKIK